jgi:uncharacterized membrane protein
MKALPTTPLPTSPSHARPARSPARLVAPVLAALVVFGLAASRALAEPPEFLYLGDLPGGSEYSVARGVSADGTYVVGDSSSTSSGVINFASSAYATEGFIWDAASGMTGMGDVASGAFSSSALKVSPDGQVAIGASIDFGSLAFGHTAAVRWHRGPPATLTAIAKAPANTRFTRNASAVATAMSGSGETVFGTVAHTTVAVINEEEFYEVFSRVFSWTPAGGVSYLDTVMPEFALATVSAATADGQTIIGNYLRSGFIHSSYRLTGLGLLDLGSPFGNNNLYAHPVAISADRSKIVGGYYSSPPNLFLDEFGAPPNPTGAYLWTEGAQPPYVQLRADGFGAAGISANGRVILDSAGGLYLDGEGPYELREILAAAEVPGFRTLPAADFRASAISADGLIVVGSVYLGGIHKAWRVRLHDVDANGLPDELEQLSCGLYGNDYLNTVLKGSKYFKSLREDVGYGQMLPYYGLPWKPETSRVPSIDAEQPAEFLRAVQSLGGCPGVGAVNTEMLATRFLEGVAFPAVEELHAFEMLLGNEALADALDPTIGLDGIDPDDISDVFAFKGVPGIQDLLDEELALLRGRELPGAPADWLNEAIYYPSYANPDPNAPPDKTTRRAAVYNRLPPNGAGANAAAYLANYGAGGNYDAAGKFPQGHGDAYGHYLSAIKAGIELLRDGPDGLPPEHSEKVVDAVAESDVGLTVVRNLAEAAVARAQSAAQVVELLFRRDYRENPADPRAIEIFRDPVSQRAWSMSEWARRGAIGAYLDWAVASHWAPTDDLRPVQRANLVELEELSGVMASFQERLDTAGAALDPLGLVQNVVPFGIDASGLGRDADGNLTGRSHYEQVREAAGRALDNARDAFDLANRAGQRLRDADKTFEDFSDKLEDMRADLEQQLIEIFGLPSEDDDKNNDFDDDTSDFEESEERADLANFLATDEVLAAQGKRARKAPGEVQIGISELRVAALRLEQAEIALDNNAAQIRSQIERIELLSDVQAERLRIINSTCRKQEDLTRRMEKVENRKRATGMLGGIISGGITAALPVPKGPRDLRGLISVAGEAFSFGLDKLLEFGGAESSFDIEVERQQALCAKEIAIQGLEDELQLDAERRQLEGLVRQTPQLLVDRAVQIELATQALGRLRQAVSRGDLILTKKLRLEARATGDLIEERWKDMAFRVLRNSALKNYRALFDIAARYVVLTVRAFAYEFDRPSDADATLAGIYRERRLGRSGGASGGLHGIVARLDTVVPVIKFNRPLESLGEVEFSFRRNLLGIDETERFPMPDLRFRAFLESHIVDRLEDLNEIRELAQISEQVHAGPAIVLPFATEINGRNFFGKGPDLPFGNTNFPITRNAKIRNFAIRFDGVDASLGTDPQLGTVFVYLLPVGDSVLRENNNKPRIEDEPPVPWAVVDQFLPVPPHVFLEDLSAEELRHYSPWRTNAQASGNFLNEIKRHRESVAQIELGQREPRFNTSLAGRSAWNTRWLLAIPGRQWTANSDPSAIRLLLRRFIYGVTADPRAETGIRDIRLKIQAYSH